MLRSVGCSGLHVVIAVSSGASVHFPDDIKLSQTDIKIVQVFIFTANQDPFAETRDMIELVQRLNRN